MIQPADVHELVSHWWFAYDNAIYDEWADMFTDDVHFTCRTDTGKTNYEEFVNADVCGKAVVLAWQIEHRKGSPHPLRHGGENVHISANRGDDADFRSYIRVSQIISGSPSDLSTALVTGTVRLEGGVLRFSALHTVLVIAESTVIGERKVF